MQLLHLQKNRLICKLFFHKLQKYSEATLIMHSKACDSMRTYGLSLAEFSNYAPKFST